MDRRIPDRLAHGLGRCIAAALVALLALVPIAAPAQPAGKVYRIGYIQTATAEEQRHLTRAFEEGMRQLGYVEGRNVVYERRFADGRQERLPVLAAELVGLKVDVIVTGGNPVIGAVKQATTTIPVVMAASRDPVGSGFIAALARPGGNITGLTSDTGEEIQGKRLEILKQMVPRASRVAVLWNPVPPGAEAYRQGIEAMARKMGLRAHAVPVRGRDEFEAAFAALARDRVDAVVVQPDPMFYTARRQVAEGMTKHLLSAVFHAREFVELGGLVSYGASLAHQFRTAASYVDKILKGAKPGDLAVEQPTTFELAINETTAKALGLAIPPALKMRAEIVP
jgi:putative ABC transport system substrate-binding protein